MPKNLYQNLPPTPGVYIMKNAKGEILYIGKAVNLKRRVSSYFQKAHEYRIEKLVSQIRKIDYEKTDTGLEALILESDLIKKHQPPFNVLEKDDRSFLYVEITKEKFPRVLLVRGKDKANSYSSNSQRLTSNIYYGPFISSSAIREAMKIIRRIFPYSTHNLKTPLTSGYTLNPKPCFDYGLGLCPGTCVGAISQKDYAKNIKNIKLFFAGKKKKILESLKKEIRVLSKNLEFEKAEKTKHQIFALQHIQDTAFISESEVISPKLLVNSRRIEGYDISNISGTSAVGSMVVFMNGKPERSSYRKFKIYTVKGPDDTGMIKEILSRRLRHKEWPFPDLILIDGGGGQINAAKSALVVAGLKIPVIGIVKGPERKRNDIIGLAPKWIDKKVLIQVRDEAHRFAISYHKKLRRKQMVN
ncbi:MAG: excinuclease ABC subunit UvrC [Patescibacteria group bacterium]